MGDTRDNTTRNKSGSSATPALLVSCLPPPFTLACTLHTSFVSEQQARKQREHQDEVAQLLARINGHSPRGKGGKGGKGSPQQERGGAPSTMLRIKVASVGPPGEPARDSSSGWLCNYVNCARSLKLCALWKVCALAV